MLSRFHAVIFAASSLLLSSLAQGQVDGPAPHDHVADYPSLVEMIADAYPSRDKLARDATVGLAYSYIIRMLQWPAGHTISVCFHLPDPNDYPAQRDTIERIIPLANNWTGPQRANVKFDFGPPGNRRTCSPNDGIDIRIAFDRTQPRRSAIGTFRPDGDRNSPNMNMYFHPPELAPNSSLSWRFAYDVQHEFGHALGFIHEHQGGNCDDEIRFDLLEPIYGVPFVTRNYRNWRTALNGIISGDLSVNGASAFCAQSIMTYPIEPHYLVSGANSRCYAPRVTQMAACDYRTAMQAYPAVPGQVATGMPLRSANAVSLSTLRLATQSQTRSGRQILSAGAATVQVLDAPQSGFAAYLTRMAEIARDEVRSVFDFNARRLFEPEMLSQSGVAPEEIRLSREEQARLSRAVFFLSGRTATQRTPQ